MKRQDIKYNETLHVSSFHLYFLTLSNTKEYKYIYYIILYICIILLYYIYILYIL